MCRDVAAPLVPSRLPNAAVNGQGVNGAARYSCSRSGALIDRGCGSNKGMRYEGGA